MAMAKPGYNVLAAEFECYIVRLREMRKQVREPRKQATEKEPIVESVKQ